LCNLQRHKWYNFLILFIQSKKLDDIARSFILFDLYSNEFIILSTA